VDDALFGNKENSGKISNSIAIVSQEELRAIRGKAEKQAQPESAIITKSELERIKRSTKIQTKEQKSQQNRLIEEQKDQQMAAAKARKERMVKNDRLRASRLPKNEFEIEATEKTETRLTMAQDQLDEELDDVKHINQMMLYSKVVTIRDKQLEENKRLESDWIQEQKKLDLMMEIERLKDLKSHEEQQRQRKFAIKEGSRVIIDQIKERELTRIKEQEIREKEKHQLLMNIEQAKSEDAKLAEQKNQQIKKLLSAVEDTNAEAISLKEVVKLKEKVLEQEIVDYNRKRDLKEEELAREAARLREEKEREIQRLREL